ncbi:MAG: hypothetical protein ACRDN9_18500 [Streptosporangiaceae bacterium]
MEGPMLGDRLYGVYVRASGGQRAGKQIAKILNSAVNSAVRRGVLVADDPLGHAGVKPCTYRLPDQPVVCARQLGPRTLDQVPPSELAALMALVSRDYGWEERGDSAGHARHAGPATIHEASSGTSRACPGPRA